MSLDEIRVTSGGLSCQRREDFTAGPRTRAAQWLQHCSHGIFLLGSGHEPTLSTPEPAADSAAGEQDAGSDRYRRGRGDVAPFTGLGAVMRAAGHSVTIATADMWEGLVSGCGLEFRSLPGSQRTLDDPRWLEGKAGSARPARMIRLIAEHTRRLQGGILAVARQDAPDVLALTGITALGGHHVAEGLDLHGMGLQLQPVTPTREFPPSLVGARSLGRLGNRAAGRAAAATLALGLAGPAREIRRGLGLPPRSVREALSGQPDASRWPVFHGFSPAVVPRPADWPASYQVTGYWWPARPAGWRPPAGLEKFLDSGPSPVFFGFGSLTPEDTGDLTELAAAAGRQAGVRLVIQAGQAGPPSARRSPGDSIIIGDVPHDWLFPKMAALVHHAGGGTTAAGLRAGVPAVTVPHVGDQPFWAARLAALGAGPPPIPAPTTLHPRARGGHPRRGYAPVVPGTGPGAVQTAGQRGRRSPGHQHARPPRRQLTSVRCPALTREAIHSCVCTRDLPYPYRHP
jgi:sterol 3beta-glucosyltransferase